MSLSLTNALFLDPHRDSREVWLVAEDTGQRGDGSQANPYNCSSLPHPTIPILQIILTKDSPPAPYEATALTAGLHGFREGDMVSVAGGEVITDPNNGYAGFANVNYHGTFRIKSVSSRSFTYQMLGRPYHTTAQASVLNPLACWREREQFDVILRALLPNTTIHLGPGVFETKGFAADNVVAGRWTLGASGQHVVVPGSWAAQSGQRIIGSGMASTILKLVGATARNSKYAAISASNKVNDEGYLDGFEASDFSVDCNAEGQYSPHVACAAIQLQRGGRHVRIRRVRAIRFGSRAPDYYVENFVFYISVPLSSAPGDLIDERRDGHDCVLEDCIAEQRSPNVMWNNSILLIGGGDLGVIPYYARGCAIRNCFVNDEYVYGPLVAVETIDYSSGVATLTTKWAHGHTHPGNLAVRGCSNNAFNGVFAIESIDPNDPKKLTYKPFSGASGTQTGEIYIGGGVSSHTVAVTPLTGIQHDASDPTLIYKLTTSTPHRLTENNEVRVSGVEIGNDVLSAHFNGLFRITEILSATQLKFEILTAPPPEADLDDIDYVGSQIQIHQPSAALTVAGGTAAVAEGNRIYHCGTAGPWHDTFSTLDSTGRNNHCHDVMKGPTENLGRPPVHTYVGGTITSQGLIATVDRGAAHGFSVGDAVSVTGAMVNGSEDNPYNGIFEVESISPDSPSTWFRYKMSADPGVSAPTGTPKSARLWQTRRLIIEDNIIELAFNPYPYLYGQPSGLYIAGSVPDPINPIYQHLDLIARGNVIRHNDNLYDPSGTPFAIALGGIGRAIIESNITNLQSIYPAPIIHNNSATLKFAGNRSVSGKLEQGFDQITLQKNPDLENAVADATILSL